MALYTRVIRIKNHGDQKIQILYELNTRRCKSLHIAYRGVSGWEEQGWFDTKNADFSTKNLIGYELRPIPFHDFALFVIHSRFSEGSCK